MKKITQTEIKEALKRADEQIKRSKQAIATYKSQQETIERLKSENAEIEKKIEYCMRFQKGVSYEEIIC